MMNIKMYVFQGVGKLKEFKLKVHIDSEVEPIAQQMYRIPFTLRVIVVSKPNGDIRLCVDMRVANKAINRDRHPYQKWMKFCIK